MILKEYTLLTILTKFTTSKSDLHLKIMHVELYLTRKNTALKLSAMCNSDAEFSKFWIYHKYISGPSIVYQMRFITANATNHPSACICVLRMRSVLSTPPYKLPFYEFHSYCFDFMYAISFTRILITFWSKKSVYFK